jgi:DNA polymerase IV
MSSVSTTELHDDFSTCPPIFVSATHRSAEELHLLEDELLQVHANLTYDIHEAKIVLTKATKKARILFDLRANGLVPLLNAETPEPSPPANENALLQSSDDASIDGLKRKRQQSLVSEPTDVIVIDDSHTDSDGAHERSAVTKAGDERSRLQGNSNGQQKRLVQAVKTEWIENSLKAGRLLPADDYVLLSIFCTLKFLSGTPAGQDQRKSTVAASIPPTRAVGSSNGKGNQIIERAAADAPSSGSRYDRSVRSRYAKVTPHDQPASWKAGQGSGSQYAHLLKQTTTEHDMGYSTELPPMPDWVREGVTYSCLRSTPGNGVNVQFVNLLKEIQEARLLTNDEVGVRAYATSVAAIAAYPYKLSSPREVLAIPGCDVKIANLFVEWANTGQIRAVEDLEKDPDLKILKMFYKIWGVGSLTAREIYYDKGWRDLDDIVEFGWSSLTRVQQIGVKFYDEFLDLIPRIEVERIAATIHQHAVKVRNSGIQSMIVGGYRRGKEACGDVDVLISHPDETQTLNLINDIVLSLEEEEWITHTLLLSLINSKREQQTLPFRSLRYGSGFDTLDKALVVWQDPEWPDKARDLQSDPDVKNPNIHRRVDIIIAPWKTVGCAIVGW